jgi:hypothetical protein
MAFAIGIGFVVFAIWLLAPLEEPPDPNPNDHAEIDAWK